MGHKKLALSDRRSQYPEFLKKDSIRSIESLNNQQPVLIEMSKTGSDKELEKLINSLSEVLINDNYDEQYAELLLSRNAHLYRAKYSVQQASIKELLEKHYSGEEPWRMGSWVYFPWNGQIVHILAQEDFEELRTIRNRDLINKQEQKILFNTNVAVFGMSVGSATAQAVTLSGMSRKIKLIDGAVISGSNLNRILTGVTSVGQGKAAVISRQIYEMNPYSSVKTYDKAKRTNIEEILTESWPVSVIVDEIDDIEMKVRIRNVARERGLPVVMATELGDTIMIDVERYDLEPNRELLHGMIPGIEKLLESPIENYREWTKHAVKIIDPKNMPYKMQKSLLKIGTTVVTHPQLGSTVMMTGGALAFVIKNIALGSDIRSGRYVVSLENEFLKDHQTRHHKRKHKKHTKVILKSVDSM